MGLGKQAAISAGGSWNTDLQRALAAHLRKAKSIGAARPNDVEPEKRAEMRARESTPRRRKSA